MTRGRRERLPDGRVLRATLDGVYWVCQLEGTGETDVSGDYSGRLSGMALADPLGYRVEGLSDEVRVVVVFDRGIGSQKGPTHHHARDPQAPQGDRCVKHGVVPRSPRMT